MIETKKNKRDNIYINEELIFLRKNSIYNKKKWFDNTIDMG